jgi:hypothetical protein
MWTLPNRLMVPPNRFDMQPACVWRPAARRFDRMERQLAAVAWPKRPLWPNSRRINPVDGSHDRQPGRHVCRNSGLSRSILRRMSARQVEADAAKGNSESVFATRPSAAQQPRVGHPSGLESQSGRSRRKESWLQPRGARRAFRLREGGLRPVAQLRAEPLTRPGTRHRRPAHRELEVL